MSRAAKVCTEPGCPVLVPGGGLCGGECHPGCRRRQKPRPSARAMGYNSEWERTRRAYLLAHPWCHWPGCSAPAKHVDHDDGQGPLSPRGHDWSNLVGYCHPHHSTKTALYDGAFGNTPKPRGVGGDLRQHHPPSGA